MTATGPFHDSALTHILSGTVAAEHRNFRQAVLHDVQYRAGYYYGIAEVVIHQAHRVGRHYYGMTTAPVPLHAPGRFVVYGGYEIFVWQHPNDPLLPGLALAATPAQVQHHFAPDRELSSLQTVTYRPMNRAVFKAHLTPRSPGGLGDTIYLKVLRAGAAEFLYHLHHRLAVAGVPVVGPVAAPIYDVIAFAAGRGMPLGELARADGVSQRFDARQLSGLLDRFPAALLDYPYRPSWADRYPEFVEAARIAMPDHDARLAHLGYRLGQAHRRLQLGPLVPTHGDLYEAHILVEPATGQIQQILDVDGAGPGYRVDDYACLIGHMAVLGHTDRYPWGWHVAMRFFQQLAPYTNPTTLAVRSAAVVLSLIPGYQASQQAKDRGSRYLAVAEALLDTA